MNLAIQKHPLMWLIVMIFGFSNLSGQVTRLNIDPASGCNYFGNENLEAVIYGFSGSREAEAEMRQIVEQVGLKPNFVIKAANVPNAKAQIIGGERYILYSQQFMDEIVEKTGDYWSKVAILAHEVGHHLQGHTLKDADNRPELELEADEFSGFVLYKSGASLEQAQKAVRTEAPAFNTPGYPSRNARLEAIAVGYKRAEELNGGQQNRNPEPFNPPPSPGNTVTLAGQTYKTVRLNGKAWLAENLNYNIGAESYCYGGDPINCLEYGRLYTWDAAKKACAALGDGWRLPTDEDWAKLIHSFGGYEKSYPVLMKGGSSGFDALLGGGRNDDGEYLNLGRIGYYWSATQFDADNAWSFGFYGFDGRVVRNSHSKSIALSCRCLKDN